VPKKLVG